MKKKLTLNKETLRHLTASSLEGIRGGSIIGPTGWTYCLQCGSNPGTLDCPPSDTKRISICNCPE